MGVVAGHGRTGVPDDGFDDGERGACRPTETDKGMPQGVEPDFEHGPFACPHGFAFGVMCNAGSGVKDGA